MRSPKHHLLRT